jgi:hypothetical protein
LRTARGRRRAGLPRPGPGRCARPGARSPGAAELHVGHLQLRERLANRPHVVAELPLDERQQRAHALDGQADLIEVPLALGGRPLRSGRQPEPPAAEVHERDDGLDDHVVDSQALELGLVGGAELLLGRLSEFLLAHAVLASWR